MIGFTLAREAEFLALVPPKIDRITGSLRVEARPNKPGLPRSERRILAYVHEQRARIPGQPGGKMGGHPIEVGIDRDGGHASFPLRARNRNPYTTAFWMPG